MTTSIRAGAASAPRLSIVATSTRETPRAGIGAALKSGFVHVGRAARDGLGAAAPFLPTGTVLSAARAGLDAGSGAGPLGPGAAAGGDGRVGSLMDATTRMTELNAAYNLRYLQLQQQIQADTREFNLVSNVLKTRHDAAKNALANIR